ncbi:MAG: enoyl-CoA hydratase/isomerase family protein [Acidobacteriota bacterium]|nr:enoyl-CoA hydratase/isomerase family protein [Acidobacteriota bacterium]
MSLERPETIEFAVEANVATITLNRPDKLNSFNRIMAAEVSEAWSTVRDDDSIHVAVLQANGDRAFCTGIDVKEGVWWYDLNIWNQTDPGSTLGPKHHGVWKPVVAAVNGMCAGGGMYFINEADIIICSEAATFFDPHANGGVVSALEPIGLLKRGVPVGDVLRWALMGNEERIGPESALRLGIVSEVVPAADLRTRAREIADGIARRRPVAVQGTVRAIWEALDMTRSTALQNALSYTHIGNPPPGSARSTFHLDRPTEVR